MNKRSLLPVVLILVLFASFTGAVPTPNTQPVAVDNRPESSTYQQVTVPADFWTNADPLQRVLSSGQHYGIFSSTGALVNPTASTFYEQSPPPLSCLPTIPWTKTSGVEQALGNPPVNGYVLSSTISGQRSWITPGAGVFVGTQTTGARLSWGSVETFAGQSAAVSIQTFGTQNGLDVHSAGTGNIAIIGQSDTGAGAGKFVQTTHFDFPCLFVWRNGTTISSDAPLMDMKSWGVAPILQVETTAGAVPVVDANAAIHPPHIADSAAQNDSEYFSTNLGKLCYKDSSGAVHALY